MKVWQHICAAVIAGVVLGVAGLSDMVRATPSPLSRDAVFTKTHEGVPNIWRASVHGERQRQLTRSGAHSPVWSPDGRRLVFITSSGAMGVMRADGRGVRYLHTPHAMMSRTPVWSPDGSKIAFVRTAPDRNKVAVFVVHPDGTGMRNISGWASRGDYRDPSWAPDSIRLVYEYARPNAPSDLLIGNVITGKNKLLTNTSDVLRSRPQWSPDGTKILFQDSASEAYTIRADGSSRSVISDGDSRNARWSAAGSRIVFVEDDNISLVQEDGTVISGLLAEGAYRRIDNLAWSPDGQRLLFTAETVREASVGLFLLQVTPEGRAPIRLHDGAITDVSWRPGNRYAS